MLENVKLEDDHEVDFTDTSITENTRGAYPIHFIKNAHSMHGGTSDGCDLPDVRRVRRAAAGQRPVPGEAMYHFISGYTAKVAGTEVGVKEPTATFSPCFGGPFLVWHPNKYAELLAAKMRQHQTRLWLVNTGWSGGGYGAGKRIKLAHTRAIIDAIHTGKLVDARRQRHPVFGFDVPAECPGVPAEILWARDTWADPVAYDAAARKLAGLFVENFKTYEDRANEEVRAASPVV